jgi:hypothetical protein
MGKSANTSPGLQLALTMSLIISAGFQHGCFALLLTLKGIVGWFSSIQSAVMLSEGDPLSG